MIFARYETSPSESVKERCSVMGCLAVGFASARSLIRSLAGVSYVEAEIVHNLNESSALGARHRIYHGA